MKVTLDKEEAPQSIGFKKGQIVKLKDGLHTEAQYKDRLIIVTEDTYPSGWAFCGFCLVDLTTSDTFNVKSFELYSGTVTLSN